jgi:8-oxo-dGTP pyrophosphatase MutT (NUDIX family)
MTGSWRTVSSKTLLKDRWIDVRADSCVTPSGHEVDPYYVLNYPDWVHVVAITPQDELVLVRQYRHAARVVLPELPGGVIDREDPSIEAAGRRELKEETGYQASVFKPICSLFANPAIQTNRVHTFLALDAELSGSSDLDEGEDGLTVHLAPMAEVLAGLRHGLLQQSLQMSSLLMALTASGHIGISSR